MAIRIAVAGMGARGQDWVREVRASSAFELAACVDVEPAALQQASARFGISPDQCFTDLGKALDSSGSQAVIVVTPPDCHATTCEAALDRNLGVLVEKPFTLRLSEAVRLVSLAGKNGAPLLVAQNYRYLRSFRTVKRLINDGLLGRVGMVVCHYYRPFHNIPNSLARLPNSVLWGMSVHHLDALQYVLASKVTNVNAEIFTLPWGRLPRGASLQLMLATANDTRVSYSATYVWPTFLTGSEPTAHGIYSEWKWLPALMNLRRYEGHHLTPFWKSLSQQGVSTGVFDVPFAPPVGIKHGFEVCEWWAHDSTAAGLRAAPDEIRSLVRESEPHPLSTNRFVTATPDSKNNIEELAAACCAGVRLRGLLARRLIQETNPQLSVVVFPEIHHAGHQLWHTIAFDHPIYDGLERNGKSFEPLLKDVHRAIDEQIGELIASGNADTVMVFALHGMRPALGFPAFLGPLLCERGFSQLATWRS